MSGSTPVIIGLLGVIALLGGICIHQQLFYTKQIKELVERLMARSLPEYERAKNPPPARHIVKPEPPMESFDRIVG